MKLPTLNKAMLPEGHDGRYLVKMERLGLLKAGAVVSALEVEQILECKYEEKDWKFLGRYLVLKSLIESRGFFVTQKDQEAPGFRLLSTQEMAEHAQNRLAKAMGMCYKNALIMSSHDGIEALTDTEKKKYSFMRNKSAQSALMMQKILLDDVEL